MYGPDSRPSTASSVDLASLASFPLPPFYESPASMSTELRQTSPPWTAFRQTLPPAPRPVTPEDEDFPHAAYFAATSTPPRHQGLSHEYPTLFEFDEIDATTPDFSSSSRSTRSQASPFPSPTASTSSSIDSELYASPDRTKRDIGLGLWLAEQEKKAHQMERAMSQLRVSAASSFDSASSSSSSSSSSSYSPQNDYGVSPLSRFDPFGQAEPVKVQRASFIKFETAPPVRQSLLRPVPVRPEELEARVAPSPKVSLLPAAPICANRDSSYPSPFAARRPSYVPPGPEPSPSPPSVSLSPSALAHIASLHNGRVPTAEQLAPAPQDAADGSPPPIVNTGNQGKMVVQAGDWRCGSCTFVNWRRRKICMRCFPFASNDIGQSFAKQSQRAALLASSPMASTFSAPSSLPRRPTPPTAHAASHLPIPRSNSLPTSRPSPETRTLPMPYAALEPFPSPQQFDHYFSRTASLPPPAPSPTYPSFAYPHSEIQYLADREAQLHYLGYVPRRDDGYASTSPSALDHYTQYERSPFPPRSPVPDKHRRRVGGVIGCAGVAY
ncbi:hypothetical protein JCM10212_000164 [Sporobolomyces blumeae]